MTWWQGNLSSTRPSQDAIAKLVQMGTSKTVATVTVAAGGTGYAEGDVLTLTHASAVIDATFVVTSVSSGVIQSGGLRIRNGGAFGRRVATVAINAAGTSYNADDVVEIDEGHVAGTDFFQRCKIKIDTVNGSNVPTAISILEGGGNYAGGTDPSASASTTTLVGPNAGSGSGLTVNVTMQAIISSLSGLSVTGGGGSGATVTITLGDETWQADVDRHNFSQNGVTDEREVILTSQISTGDPAVIGMRTFTASPSVTTHEGIMFTAMDTVNPSLAYSAQNNIQTESVTVSTAEGAYCTLFHNTATAAYLSVTDRKMMGAFFNDGVTVDSYVSFYLGLGNPFGTATENPYPMLIMASSNNRDITPDAGGIDQSNLVEQFRHSSRDGPFWLRSPEDKGWDQFYTGAGTAFNVTGHGSRGATPLFAPAAQTGSQLIVATGAFTYHNSVGRNTGAAPTIEMRPSPGTTDKFVMESVVVVREVEEDVHCELEGVYWTVARNSAGSVLSPLDTITDDAGNVYVAFPSGDRVQQYSFMFFREGA